MIDQATASQALDDLLWVLSLPDAAMAMARSDPKRYLRLHEDSRQWVPHN